MTDHSSALPKWIKDFQAGPAPLSIDFCDGVFRGPNGREVRMVASSQDALLSMAEQADDYINRFQSISTDELPEDQSEEFNEKALETSLEGILDNIKKLLIGHDALDVMVMLRQYLLPPDLSLHEESGSSIADSWAVAEVIALILLGEGLPDRNVECKINTASIIPVLVEEASKIVALAIFKGLSRAGLKTSNSPAMSNLASQLSSHEISVRGRQYPQVADEINEHVLKTPQSDKVFLSVLGYTYQDVREVREAISELIGQRVGKAETVVATAVQHPEHTDNNLVDALRQCFENPSELFIVSALEISGMSGVLLERVTSILDVFSVRPDGRDSRRLIREFVDGRNPMAGKAIICADRRGYLPLPGAIASDEIRRTCESKLKDSPSWTKYGRARDHEAEGLVTDTLNRLFDSRANIYPNLRYHFADGECDVSSGSSEFNQSPIGEADALVLIDGVAVCVEVKAGNLREKARQGQVAQLGGDLKKTINAAATQADRLRSLIEEHQGVWLDNGRWMDLESVGEIYSIVVCLDDLGPLSLATSELVESGILKQENLPWIVTVHDLLVFAEVLDRPETFLTYLRRRTTRDASRWIAGSDELDILMWFVAGGLYFEPDPDEMYAKYPMSKQPTDLERRSYQRQGRTIVGTLTDPLDAYFYYKCGASTIFAECPHRKPIESTLRTIFDEMSRVEAPGWLRASSDIDSLSRETQEQVAQGIKDVLVQSSGDNSYHTITYGFMDTSGRSLFVFASSPATPLDLARLHAYLQAKKYQLQADRGLGVMISPCGKPVSTVWLSSRWEENPDLEDLAREMKLVSPTSP